MIAMPSQIDERLESVRKRLHTARGLEETLRDRQEALCAERERYAGLSERIARAGSKIRKLDGFGPTGFYHRLMGTREARLHDERQVHLAAESEYAQSLQTAEDLGEEVARLRDALAKFEDVDAEYEQLLLEKEERLLEIGGTRAEKLRAVSQELADLRSDRRKLDAAILVGEAAAKELRKLADVLSSAATWGTIDLFSDDIVSNLSKQSKVEAAQGHAHYAQEYLWEFQRRLDPTDVFLLHFPLDDSKCWTTTDCYLDDLISEWVVLSRIDKSSAECEQALSRVEALLVACRRRLRDTDRSIEELAANRAALIERT